MLRDRNFAGALRVRGRFAVSPCPFYRAYEGEPPGTSVDTSNCYACAVGRAMDLVYSVGRTPIAHEEHSMWSGESWEAVYPGFAMRMAETFPAEMQKDA